MDAPPVQYVTTSDGFEIAYGVSGSGPPLVFAGSSMSHVQLAWQMPRVQDLLAGLAERFQVVQFDIRGTGLSARGISEDLAVEDYQRDIEVVVDR